MQSRESPFRENTIRKTSSASKSSEGNASGRPPDVIIVPTS